MEIWDKFLTERDREVYKKAGYGAQRDFGARPALLIVDVNYNFVGPEPMDVVDSIDVWRNSCGHEGWASVASIQRLLEGARATALPIFYTTGTEPRADGFGKGMWRNTRVREQPRSEGFAGNDIVSEIAPESRDILIRKLKPSAFFGTPLSSYLVELGVDSLLVCGATTSGCVRASVIDAFSNSFSTFVIQECTFDRGEASHAVNLFDMNAKYADVVKLSTTLDYIARLPTGLFDDVIQPPPKEEA